MLVDKKRRVAVWIVWAIVFPLILWYAYVITPFEREMNWVGVFSFAVLLIGAAMLPIVVNNTPLSITQWVTLAAFLNFGLFTELIFAQIAVFVVLFRLKLPREQWYRYPLDSTMFAFVSLISGQFYYLFGGSHDQYTIDDFSFITLAIGYIFVYFFANQGLLTLLHLILYKEKKPVFSEDFFWELLLLIGIFPIGIILYFLYNTMGLISTLLIGIPVMSMLLILNIYYRSQQMNHYLKKAVEFGHRLTERLRENEVLDVFIQNLTQIFPVDYLYVLQKNNEDQLQLSRKYEREKLSKSDQSRRWDEIPKDWWRIKEASLYKEKKEWKPIFEDMFRVMRKVF